MAAEITDITPGNQFTTEDMHELLSTVAETAERTKRIEDELTRLLAAWASGGLRGLRIAARNGGSDD